MDPFHGVTRVWGAAEGGNCRSQHVGDLPRPGQRRGGYEQQREVDREPEWSVEDGRVHKRLVKRQENYTDADKRPDIVTGDRFGQTAAGNETGQQGEREDEDDGGALGSPPDGQQAGHKEAGARENVDGTVPRSNQSLEGRPHECRRPPAARLLLEEGRMRCHVRGPEQENGYRRGNDAEDAHHIRRRAPSRTRPGGLPGPGIDELSDDRGESRPHGRCHPLGLVWRRTAARLDDRGSVTTYEWRSPNLGCPA